MASPLVLTFLGAQRYPVAMHRRFSTTVHVVLHQLDLIRFWTTVSVSLTFLLACRLLLYLPYFGFVVRQFMVMDDTIIHFDFRSKRLGQTLPHPDKRPTASATATATAPRRPNLPRRQEVLGKSRADPSSRVSHTSQITLCFLALFLCLAAL